MKGWRAEEIAAGHFAADARSAADASRRGHFARDLLGAAEDDLGAAQGDHEMAELDPLDDAVMTSVARSLI